MERYEVYYKKNLIGYLAVNEKNEYAYEPVAEGVEAVKDTACLLRVMVEGTSGFGEPIPFFAERLKYMKIWNRDEIRYHTDWFAVCKIKKK